MEEINKPETISFNISQIQQISEPKVRLAVWLAYDLLLRSSEIRTLKMRNFKENHLEIKNRSIAYTPRVRADVPKILNHGGTSAYLFPGRWKGQCASIKSLERKIEKFSRGNWTLHCVRTQRLLQFRKEGVERDEIARRAGYKSKYSAKPYAYKNLQTEFDIF